MLNRLPALAAFFLLTLPLMGQLSWVTRNLNYALLNQPYEVQLSASDASAIITVSSGSLPPGMFLTPSGLLTGTPTQAGSFYFVARATVGLTSVFQDFNLQVTPTLLPLTLRPATLPIGTINTSYTATINTLNVQIPFTVRLASGALPDGLSLTFINGNITFTGIPRTAGISNFTLEIPDSYGITRTFPLSINILESPLNITTSSLPEGFIGIPYSFQLAATGGIPPYRFERTAPGTYQISPSGLLTLTPQSTGTLNIAVSVTDATSTTVTRNLPLSISVARLTIASTTLPEGATSTPYRYTLPLSGGTSRECSVTSGQLPTGFSLTNCDLVGTTLDAGIFNFTLRVSSPPIDPLFVPLSLRINRAALTLSSSTAILNTGAAPFAPLTAVGGVPPYQFRLKFGDQLPGARLLTNGAFTPTPLAARTLDTAVEVIDSTGATFTQSIRFSNNSTPSIIPAAPYADGFLNVPYQQNLGASPIPCRAFTVRLSNGTLPPGLSLSPTGLISGIPARTGATDFDLTVLCPSTQLPVKARITITEPIPTLALNDTIAPRLGLPYSASLTAGGIAPFTCELTSGALAPGLRLEPNCAITGTPTATGPFTFAARLTDSRQSIYRATLTSTVYPNIPILNLPDTLPNAESGRPYTFRLPATTLNEDAFTITPHPLFTIERGFILTGTPPTPGLYEFRVFALRDNTPIGLKTIRLTVLPSSTTTLPEQVLPPATLGATYSTRLALPGASQYLPSSTTPLPAGLEISTQGVISGTPRHSGQYSFYTDVIFNDQPTTPVPVLLTLLVNPIGPYLSSGGQLAPLLRASTNRTPIPTLNAPAASVLTLDNQFTPQPPNLTLERDSSGAWQALYDGFFFGPIRFGLTITTPSSLPVPAIAELTMSASAQPLRLTTPRIAAVLNERVLTQLSATGGTPPYRFTLTPNFPQPASFSLDPYGALSGTPILSGLLPLAVTVTDSYGLSDTRYLSLDVQPARQPVTSSDVLLPSASLFSDYSASLGFTGGKAPYTANIRRGTLPPGLAIDPNGLLTGTPLASGTFTFTVDLTDDTITRASREFTLTIPTPVRLPAAQTATAYNYPLPTAGLAQPARFQLATPISSLPTGLSLAPTGQLSGTPLTAGLFHFAITSFDAQGLSRTTPYTLRVTPSTPLRLDQSGLPSGFIGRPYSLQLTARGATLPLTFTLSEGQLPAGFTLSPTGLISGLSPFAGTATFTITATQSPTLAIHTRYQLHILAETQLTLTTLVSAASYQSASVAPAELLTAFGSGIGPTILTPLALNADGRITTTLAGATVYAGSTPLPLIYTQLNQLSFIAPWVLDDSGTWFTIEYNGRQTAPLQLPTVPARPALFTLDSSGQGPAAILNQDGSLNTPQRPAVAGEVAVAFLTGAGTIALPGPLGAIATTTNPIIQPTAVTVCGQPAAVAYSGSAPGLVEAVTQLNFTIPAGLPPGPCELRLTIGDETSPTGVTIHIR